MKKWEHALQKFIKKWKSKKEVVGAIVCGSYITGNPSKHSDIDIQIILNSKVKWRERGNEIIDGIIIEYFANPAKSHYKYAEEDYKQRRKINPHMFCTGKVLFDKTGELKKIIRDSRKYFFKKYPKMGKIQVELAKYHIWDMLDNLEEVHEGKGEEFFFVFYNYIYELFEFYSKFMQFESISTHKIKRFLVDDKDKKKYYINDFPDKDFINLFVAALKIKEKDKMILEYKNLTNYVLDKMGGFKINGWKIRSPAK